MVSNNILVIDDEPVICNACHLVLSEQGYVVDFCLNGRTGLNAILEGTYDIILLDMKLPDINGMDLLKTIRTEKPGMPIIVMTGFSTVQNAAEAMKAGAFDYLAKPFSDDELLLAVGKAVKRNAW